MSRNKTIKLLHDVTLKSYAECRAALKRNHWDLVTTYYYMNDGTIHGAFNDGETI